MGAPDRQHFLAEKFGARNERDRGAVCGRLLSSAAAIQKEAGRDEHERGDGGIHAPGAGTESGAPDDQAAEDGEDRGLEAIDTLQKWPRGRHAGVDRGMSS